MFLDDVLLARSNSTIFFSQGGCDCHWDANGPTHVTLRPCSERYTGDVWMLNTAEAIVDVLMSTHVSTLDPSDEFHWNLRNCGYRSSPEPLSWRAARGPGIEPGPDTEFTDCGAGNSVAIRIESSSSSLRTVVFAASIRLGRSVGPLSKKSASADKECGHRKGGGSEQCRHARWPEQAEKQSDEDATGRLSHEPGNGEHTRGSSGTIRRRGEEKRSIVWGLEQSKTDSARRHVNRHQVLPAIGWLGAEQQ